jgi:hypothetical protein
MQKKHTLALVLGGALLVAGLAFAPAAPAAACGQYGGVGGPVPLPPAKPAPRPVDLVICLDTSGSMKNLIESTKQHIWSIVNELALARPQPRLRVALLTFGNDGHAADAGWVRVDTDLTDDLDLLSERLFSLTTNGGTELVGRVLKRAHDDLSWSDEKGALKLVVLAGNESADQDRDVPFADACAALIEDDVLVNSLFCGSPADPIAAGWSAVARRADGRFFAIDTSSAPAYVESPFDEKLMTLSSDLNETYLPMGAGGHAAWANQAVQDANARGLNRANGASRAQAKAGSNYFCGWDLVDAVARDDRFDLASVKAEDLPESMREMNAKERAAHVAKMAAARKDVQERIADLSKQRAAFVAAETKKAASKGQQTFETALLTAIRDQAAAKGFSFVE